MARQAYRALTVSWQSREGTCAHNGGVGQAGGAGVGVQDDERERAHLPPTYSLPAEATELALAMKATHGANNGPAAPAPPPPKQCTIAAPARLRCTRSHHT